MSNHRYGADFSYKCFWVADFQCSERITQDLNKSLYTKWKIFPKNYSKVDCLALHEKVFLKEPQYSIKNASRRVNCIFRLCNVVLREHNERSTFFFLMKNCFEEFCDGYFCEHLRKLVFRTVSVECEKGS